MFAKHGIRSETLFRQRVFYLPMVDLGHIPYMHMVKEYEKYFCTLVSSYNQIQCPSILTQCQPFFSQSISIKKHMKRFHIQFITKLQYTILQKSSRVSFQWLRGQLNHFPKDYFMSFKLTNFQVIIHTRTISLRLSTSKIS